MQISTRSLRRLAALSAAIGTCAIAIPVASANSDPGGGFTAPSASGLNEFGIPKDLSYPGEGFTAPSGSKLNEFGIPKDLTYLGEGIEATLPKAVAVTTPQGNGFDFADAAVGGGVALGGAMLLAAAALATRRRRLAQL